MSNLSDINLSELVLNLFVRLRQRGLDLGIDEYKAGLSLVTDPAAKSLISTAEELQTSLRMVWCSSFSEQAQFEPIWQQIWTQVREKAQVEKIPSVQEEQPPPPARSQATRPEPKVRQSHSKNLPNPPAREAKQSTLTPAIQPVRAPFTPAEIDRPSNLQRYWPISRRAMSYRWRTLRRPVAAGPADQLDIPATVNQVAAQGFFLSPIMQQRTTNQAKLLLLIDQKGSMMPMHPLTRQIVETAQHESRLPRSQVQVAYFHNVPAASVYQDIFLTKPISLSALLTQCDEDTSVLIVSDAGAARGTRQMLRIRETTKFLRQMRRATPRFAWLNPVPQERWETSSAGIIANLVPMFEMSNEGLDSAMATVRGL